MTGELEGLLNGCLPAWAEVRITDAIEMLELIKDRDENITPGDVQAVLLPLLPPLEDSE